MRGPLIVITVAGCSFHPGVAPDALVDAPADEVCFGGSASSLFTVCYERSAVPSSAMEITGAVIDTTACAGGIVATSHGVTACVLGFGDLTFNGSTTVSGNLPLVLLAANDLTVAFGASVSASSTKDGSGPNANAAVCNPVGAGIGAVSGGGGGAGGSFGSLGGSGGGGGNMTATAGIAGGLTADGNLLHGGCRGSRGGDGKMNAGAEPGDSGGALYLLAGGTIQIAGQINASGAGGGGASPSSGGGGGGTGGLLGFDGAVVRFDSGGQNPRPAIVVNGGAGGGGGGGTKGERGEDGTLVSTPGAKGGKGGGMPKAGNGGVGTSWADPIGGDGGLGKAGAGGGGGGGGYGVVWIVGTYTNVNGDVSPMQPLVHP